MNASELTLLFDRSTQQGRLELTGRDRFDLLQRMSTNDFGNIQPGEGRTTVLTTAIARIIDQLIVYHRGESAVMIDNYPDVVRAWLQRHIFFRDQVKLRDVSPNWDSLSFMARKPQQLLNNSQLAAVCWLRIILSKRCSRLRKS